MLNLDMNNTDMSIKINNLADVLIRQASMVKSNPSAGNPLDLSSHSVEGVSSGYATGIDNVENITVKNITNMTAALTEKATVEDWPLNNQTMEIMLSLIFQQLFSLNFQHIFGSLTNVRGNIDDLGADEATTTVKTLNSVNMGSGDDELNISGENLINTVKAGSGDDTAMLGGTNNENNLTMGSGDDVIHVKYEGGGNVSKIDGGSGTDSVIFSGLESDYTVDGNNYIDKQGNITTIIDIENISFAGTEESKDVSTEATGVVNQAKVFGNAKGVSQADVFGKSTGVVSQADVFGKETVAVSQADVFGKAVGAVVSQADVFGKAVGAVVS